MSRTRTFIYAFGVLIIILGVDESFEKHLGKPTLRAERHERVSDKFHETVKCEE